MGYKYTYNALCIAYRYKGGVTVIIIMKQKQRHFITTVTKARSTGRGTLPKRKKEKKDSS